MHRRINTEDNITVTTLLFYLSLALTGPPRWAGDTVNVQVRSSNLSLMTGRVAAGGGGGGAEENIL